MKFPGTLTPRRFLDQHWQKKPLNIPGAIERSLPDLTADEPGWLATLEDVESRIVFTERHGDKIAYRVEHGPFANALPTTNSPPRSALRSQDSSPG